MVSQLVCYDPRKMQGIEIVRVVREYGPVCGLSLCEAPGLMVLQRQVEYLRVRAAQLVLIGAFWRSSGRLRRCLVTVTKEPLKHDFRCTKLATSLDMRLRCRV